MSRTIYAVRHAKHGIEGVSKNMIPPSEEERAIKTGQELATMGVKFDWVASSPQPRAILTAIRILQGTGANPLLPINTDPAIGDSKLGLYPYPSHIMDYLTIGAKTAKMGIEEFMLTVADDLEFLKIQHLRAIEGADFIESCPDGIGLITSHGGGKIEIMIDELIERSGCFNTQYLRVVMKELSVFELIFNDDGELTAANYLGELA